MNEIISFSLVLQIDLMHTQTHVKKTGTMENSSEKCGLTSSCHSEMCVDFEKNEQSREKKAKENRYKANNMHASMKPKKITHENEEEL